MAPRGRPKKANGPNGGANLGFEAKMWLAADELRGQVDAAVNEAGRELAAD